MLGFMWQQDSYAVAMFVAHALRFMETIPVLLGCLLFSYDASTVGLALAYTQVPGGPSSPNLSAGSSIARQAVWLDRRLMAAGCWGTSGANGGVGFPPSGVWEFPTLVWFFCRLHSSLWTLLFDAHSCLAWWTCFLVRGPALPCR